MYDAIIDHDISEDSSVSPDVVQSLASGMGDESDEENLVAAVGSQLEANEETDDEESLLGDTDTWSDDPVRMYLTQMGEIPLLTRKEEICLARRIEQTRTAFRRKLLACDYVMRSAVKVLERVHRGELPFDRTVQVSVTDRLEKEQILGRLPHNLRTLSILLDRNTEDYRVATSKSAKSAERKAAWKRLDRRRCRAVLLIEELGLRTQRIEPMIDQLHKFNDRVAQLREQMADMKKRRRPIEERKPVIQEYRALLRALQETPTSLNNRVRQLNYVHTEYQACQAWPFRR